MEILLQKELTHSIPLVSFYTPWKNQKIPGFLMFSGGLEREQWYEMSWKDSILKRYSVEHLQIVGLKPYQNISKSSYSQLFFKIGVLENFAKLTEK